MAETLSHLFQKSNGNSIEIDGRIVHPIYKEKIESESAYFIVQRLRSTGSPIQGIRIKVDRGLLEVNGQSHPDITLWADTSPDLVGIRVQSKRGCELKVWNVWRREDEVNAWIGNAGMAITRSGPSVTMECSDGVGEIDFSDLVFRIEMKEQ